MSFTEKVYLKINTLCISVTLFLCVEITFGTGSLLFFKSFCQVTERTHWAFIGK